MSCETDVVRAFTDRWNATAALASAVPGGLYTDYRDDVLEMPAPPTTVLPYAILTVELDRPQRRITIKRVSLDYRRATIDIFGKGKANLGDIVSLIHATFDPPARLLF